VRGGDAALPKITLGFLVPLIIINDNAIRNAVSNGRVT